MNYLIYILKILTYILIAILFYFACGGIRVKQSITLKTKSIHRKPKIGIISMIVLSAIFGWYSIIVSSYPYTADRHNYALRFDWNNPWTVGLNAVARFLHLFTNDVNSLFFTISFLCALLTLFAYRISREGQKEAILLLTCSDYLIFSFAGLKQAPAMALGCIAFVLLLRKKYLFSVLSLIVAILFHESAYALIPLFLICVVGKNRWLRYISYLCMVAFLFFFSGMTRVSLGIIGKYLPDLLNETSYYQDSSGGISVSYNFLVALKGLPIYIITLFALCKRSQLKNRIVDFDKYFIVSVFTSVVILLSTYSYWMKRFALLCYEPVFIFASELYNRDDNREEAHNFLYILVIITAFFTLRYLFQIFFLYGGF